METILYSLIICLYLLKMLCTFGICYTDMNNSFIIAFIKISIIKFNDHKNTHFINKKSNLLESSSEISISSSLNIGWWSFLIILPVTSQSGRILMLTDQQLHYTFLGSYIYPDNILAKNYLQCHTYFECYINREQK